MRSHIDIRVNGRVQGVFYRASAKTKAMELGLTGFMRNEPDGSVYAEVEGGREFVEKFVVWCHQGHTGARVDHVVTREGSLKEFKEFTIHH